ncbi:EamA family transporter [Streptomyces marispadix]|uniref:EamA family transporter n=1 Tax=Streptomyces marispadix TaxID=2922868 RepID=A0ABS9T1U0_9ACTN|nr:EamA family transporter [Streptomyces marispadix]MCH6162487.1 EamA family transporter [Streptomyces marispadix]
MNSGDSSRGPHTGHSFSDAVSSDASSSGASSSEPPTGGQLTSGQATRGRDGEQGAGAGRLGAVGLVIGSALSLQFGAAVAATLFPRAGALGVVALRLVFSAALLLAVSRPRLRGHSRRDWAAVTGLGVALGTMNTLFYQAIERIPLGAAVTLELLGPLVLSVAGSRRALSLVWAVLALTGVFLLGSDGFGGGPGGFLGGVLGGAPGGGGAGELDLVGVAFALGAGAMWVAYILFNSRTGARFAKTDGLALAMALAALLSAPLGLASAGRALLDPVTLGLGAAVAVLSSGVPYSLELFALRRLPAATFALLMSLMPVAATAAGFLVLGQRLGAPELVAIALVIVASMGAVRTQPRSSRTQPRPSSRARPRTPPGTPPRERPRTRPRS